MTRIDKPVTIVGAGLAGCEAAWQLAKRNIPVRLIEMKPVRFSPAHHSEGFAELVCSNSLKAEQLTNASGLLKAELRAMDSLILACAEANRVPAGGALAVDRHKFSDAVTRALSDHPLVTVERAVADAIPDSPAIVATGPLTNLGIALSLYPELAGLVRCVTMMGGAAAFGNTTPAAEFNVLADPEAAELVFRSGIPVVMCGLDVTHSTYITAREVEELAALGSVQARLAAYFMGSGIEENARQFRTGGAPLHDPCAMMYAIDRSLFESKPCWIGVERHGKVTRGKTVTDAYSDAKRTANARLVTGSDREGFIRRMMELFVGYGSEMPDEKF